MRRFFGLSDSIWIFAPVIVGTAGNAFFLLVVPNVSHRVSVATVSWMILMLGGAVTLIRNRRQNRSISATVLSGIFVLLAILVLLRGLYYATRAGTVISIAQPLN